MKVLFITVAYPKEGNSNLYSDLAEEFVRQGHEITVVSTECMDSKKSILLKYDTGVEHLSIPIENQFGVNVIKKGLINLKIPFLMKKTIKSYLNRRKYDVILYATPPVTISSTVRFTKKLFKARTYLMLKDIFPQNAVDLSLFTKKSLLYKYFKLKEKNLYDLSDTIGCMSKANVEFVEREYPGEYTQKLELFPNTRKIDEICNEINITDIRKKYNIPLNKLVFVFGGNLGKPQGIDYLLKGIHASQEISNAHFLIVGKGSEAREVESQATQLKNMTYISHLPSSEYNLVMKSCDVGLITLDPNFTIPNIPSRLLAYMHEEMPIFAATDINTDLKDIIVSQAKCGWWCELKNEKNFCDNIKQIVNEQKYFEEYGMNGRRFMINNYDVKNSISKITKM